MRTFLNPLQHHISTSVQLSYACDHGYIHWHGFSLRMLVVQFDGGIPKWHNFDFAIHTYPLVCLHSSARQSIKNDQKCKEHTVDGPEVQCVQFQLLLANAVVCDVDKRHARDMHQLRQLRIPQHNKKYQVHCHGKGFDDSSVSISDTVMNKKNIHFEMRSIHMYTSSVSKLHLLTCQQHWNNKCKAWQKQRQQQQHNNNNNNNHCYYSKSQ